MPFSKRKEETRPISKAAKHIPPSDETFARRAIEAVIGNISSMSPAPEVRIERDDGSNVLFNPFQDTELRSRFPQEEDL